MAELRQPGTNVSVETSSCGAMIPNESHCVTVPDLVVWIGPRPGSALGKWERSLKTWPRGCPRVELTQNWPRFLERERVVLKGRRGERMIF